jgi:hypothetical protein
VVRLGEVRALFERRRRRVFNNVDGPAVIENGMDGDCIITVESVQVLLISDCAFSAPPEKGIRYHKVIVDSCLFFQKQFRSFANGTVPGFDRARKLAVTAPSATHGCVLPKDRKPAVVTVSCAVAGILAVVITVLQVVIRKMCARDVPKAFQWEGCR